MSKRSELTLKVIQHDMYHTGKTKMQLETASIQSSSWYSVLKLCANASFVCTQSIQFGVEMPGQNA